MKTDNIQIKGMRAAVRDLQKAMNAYVAANNAKDKAHSISDYNHYDNEQKSSTINMQRAIETMISALGIIQSCDGVIPFENSLFLTEENIYEHYNKMKLQPINK